MIRIAVLIAFLAAASCGSGASTRFDTRILESVVSVLPIWRGRRSGGDEPEATAVAILRDGRLATNLHVVARAVSLSVRLSDGRIIPAEIIGRDTATDIALLKIAEDLPVLPVRTDPRLGEPVCAVGNQFGLGLSVTCGVISALQRTGTGFNPIEDFIQTDAALNPGSSGSALVDSSGKLIGLVSAIFTKNSDANIGVNFAVSSRLLMRVVQDLDAFGQVRRGDPGLRVAVLPMAARATQAGVTVTARTPAGAAERAGIQIGDVITAIAGRVIRKPSDATTAFQLHRLGEPITVTLFRDGRLLKVTMRLE
ncbi:MAG: trypsin-like peptidase domain-containing protein [Alphaproteobacteria bacterium]